MTEQLIEIYFNHMRIASHKRMNGRFGQLSTQHDHMPDNHRLYIDQTPANAKEWAEEVGPNTLKVVDFLLDTTQPEKLALQSIFSLKKMERRYSKYEIERACKMIISMTNRPTVKSIQSLLVSNKKNDAEQELKRKSENTNKHYGFMRGAAYYGGVDNNE